MDPLDIIYRLTTKYEAMGKEREEQEETQRLNEEVIGGLRRTIDGKKAEEKNNQYQIEAFKKENKKQEEVLETLEKEGKELEEVLAGLMNLPDETPSQTDRNHNDDEDQEFNKEENVPRDK